MTATELAEEVYQCLPPEIQKRVNRKDVNIIVRFLFETIIQALMLGDSVRIRNFGRIEATFIKGGNFVWCEPVKRMVRRKPNIKLKLVPAKRLKRMVSRARARIRALAKAEWEKEDGEVRVRTGEEGPESEGGFREREVSNLRDSAEGKPSSM